MTVRVRLPDGSYVNVQTDDPKAAAAAARKHLANKQQAQPTGLWSNLKSAASNVVDTAASAAGDIVNNFVPNWGDELYAASALPWYMAHGKSVGEGFKAGQQEYNRRQQAYSWDHPVLKGLSTSGGTAASMVLPAGEALRGASLAAKVAQGAKVGALYGAAAGAGEGEGADVGRRAANAGYGAGAGALTGALIPAATRGALSTARLARSYVPGAAPIMEAMEAIPRKVLGRPPAAPPSVRQANRMVADRLSEGSVSRGIGQTPQPATPALIAQEVQARNDAGVPAMIGDITGPLRDLTKWAGSDMGPGQTLVRNALDKRKALEGQRVRQHVQSTLPTVQDPIAFLEAQKAQARTDAAPLYQQAYARPMWRTPEIQGIENTPAFQDAMPQAYRNIRNQIDPATGKPLDPRAMGFRQFTGDPSGLPPNTPYFNLDGDQYITWDKGLSTEGYDQVIRAMNDNARAAANVNPVTGRADQTTNSVHINQRAQDLRRFLMDQNPPYAEAVTKFGDDMAHVRAFDQGQGIDKLTGHEINAQARSMPDAAKPSWMAGAGTALADAASAHGARQPYGNTANTIRQALGDDTKQAALSAMVGNPDAVNRLQQSLEWEHQGNLNWKGSATAAARKAFDADTGQAAVPRSISGALGQLAGYVAAHVSPRYRQEVQQRVAEIVTAHDGKPVEEVMQAISDHADRDRKFGDLLHRAGVGAAAVYGSNVQPLDTPPSEYSAN